MQRHERKFVELGKTVSVERNLKATRQWQKATGQVIAIRDHDFDIEVNEEGRTSIFTFRFVNTILRDIPVKVKRGVYYFDSYTSAFNFAVRNGLPTHRIVAYTLGYAIQLYVSGPYIGPLSKLGSPEDLTKEVAFQIQRDGCPFHKKNGDPTNCPMCSLYWAPLGQPTAR